MVSYNCPVKPFSALYPVEAIIIFTGISVSRRDESYKLQD